MDQDMITDITLDHLPDLSDTSVSFQIPSNSASADLLLGDHTDELDVLCNAIDDDVSFAPVALIHPRGQPLTLAELTPRVQRVLGMPRLPPRSPSRTPTQMPSSSAKPSVIQHPPTLGHRSPDKARRTPSWPKSMRRELESPLVSSERFHQLRAEVQSLAEADDSPLHVIQSAGDGSLGRSSPSCVNSEKKSNTLDAPTASEDLLQSIPEEADTPQVVGPSVNEDIVMTTGDSRPADETNIAVAVPLPKSRRNPRTSSKLTVAAGGISKRTAFPTIHVSKKTKGKPSRVREAHPVAPTARQLNPPQSIDAEEELAPPACMSGDINSKPESAQITHPNTGGLAERLVSYSNKLISSIRLSKPFPENSVTEISSDAVREADARDKTRTPGSDLPSSSPPQCIRDISAADSKPFRLSEMSPHKQLLDSSERRSPENIRTLQDGGLRAVSPMRPGKKRTGMDADQPQEYHQRGRGTTIPASADSEGGSSNKVYFHDQPRPAKKNRGHEEQSVTHPEMRDSAQHPDPPKSTMPSARTKYKPKLMSSQCKGPALRAFPYSSNIRQVQERLSKGKSKCDDEWRPKSGSVRVESSFGGLSASSQLRRDKRAGQENSIESSHIRQRSGPTSAIDLPLIEKKPNTTLPVAQLTKPVGFTFRVDARLEARKAEERLAASEPWKTHPIAPVPDVKAHRASHHAGFPIHKEGVVPNVPVVPFFFCTEQRAKEREKFDEMVKRKEEEMQRLKEEQRRREAEEEERAIKELRRKAIPKANGIPQWYADMPKREGTVVRNDG